GSFGEMLGQVHRDLPRIDDGARVVLGLDLHQAQSKLLGDGFLYRLNRHLAGLGVDEILEHLLGVGQGDLGANQRRVRYQADERAFQFTNVGADIGRDIERNIGGQDDFFLLRLLLQNCYLGFEIGRLDVGNQSPLEAAAQPVLEFRQLFGGTVAGDHDLLHGFVQRVEGVEELFLGAFLLGQELDIVHQQYIHAPELVAEADHLVVTQRVDHLVGELLTGDVADGRLGLAPLDLVSDGLHEMGLAHAHAAVEEERVVGLRWTFRYRLAGGVRKLVAAADYECVKGITRIQLRCAVPIEARLGGVRSGGNQVRGKSAVVTHGRRGGIVFRRDELHFLELEAKIIQRLLDQVRVLVSHVAEFRGGHAHEKDGPGGMAVLG